MKKPDEKYVFQELSDFILSLENFSEDLSEISLANIFFVHGDLGGLFLSDDDSKRYSHCVFLLHSIINEDLISKKEAESIFQNMILTVLDINKKQSEISFTDRLTNSMKDFKKKLKGNPVSYDVYYQVQGLSEEGLPYKFGNVIFLIYDEVQLSRFTNILNSFQGNESEENARRDLADFLSKKEINNKVVALVEKKAVDSSAAKINAIKEIKLTIDVINFFSDLIPFNIEHNGFIYLPGEFGTEDITIPMITKEDNPRINIGYETAGPFISFSFQKLLELEIDLPKYFENTSSILANPQKNTLQSKLITAIQWAGKAITTKNKEESFLLYAIALESLLLLDNDDRELNYRLSVRVAHLIGDTPDNRKKISCAIKDLYGIRSKIVHSGYYQITDVNLYEIKVYTKSCILRILNDEPFISMKSADEFIQWFDNKILS